MPTIKITQPVAVAGIHYAVGDIVTVTQQDSKLLLAFGDAIEAEEPATQAPADAPTQAPNAPPADGGVQTEALADAPTQADGGVHTDKPEEPPKDKAKAPKN